MGKQKGLIFDSTLLKDLSNMIHKGECFYEESYNRFVDFFKQVLEQELEEKDRVFIEKYYSSYVDKHSSRVNFWKTMSGKSFRRREGDGRTQ